MKRKVSVIAVALNEENSIKQILESIPKNAVDEILVVDGHSTDRTVEIARSLGYRVIYQEGSGRGAAFRTGIKNTTGDVLIFLSTDGNERPADIRKLIEKINEGYDVVIASRFGSGKSRDLTLVRDFGNRLFTFLCNMAGGTGINDSQNGFRAVTRESVEKMNIEADSFDFETEVTVKAGKLGLSMTTVPTIENARAYGKSRLKAYKDGFIILRRIIKEGLRNPPYK